MERGLGVREMPSPTLPVSHLCETSSPAPLSRSVSRGLRGKQSEQFYAMLRAFGVRLFVCSWLASAARAYSSPPLTSLADYLPHLTNGLTRRQPQDSHRVASVMAFPPQPSTEATKNDRFLSVVSHAGVLVVLHLCSFLLSVTQVYRTALILSSL